MPTWVTFCCSRRIVSAVVTQPEHARQSVKVTLRETRSEVLVGGVVVLKPHGKGGGVWDLGTVGRELARSRRTRRPSSSVVVSTEICRRREKGEGGMGEV